MGKLLKGLEEGAVTGGWHGVAQHLVSGPEQGPESFLLKMPVVSKDLGQPDPAHGLHRDAKESGKPLSATGDVFMALREAWDCKQIVEKFVTAAG